MEDTSSTLLQLPRRQYNIPLKFSNKSEKVCLTNYYEVNLGGKMSHVYQFSFDAEPAIPADSKELLFQVIKSIRRQLKEKI